MSEADAVAFSNFAAVSGAGVAGAGIGGVGVMVTSCGVCSSASGSGFAFSRLANRNFAQYPGPGYGILSRLHIFFRPLPEMPYCSPSSDHRRLPNLSIKLLPANPRRLFKLCLSHCSLLMASPIWRKCRVRLNPDVEWILGSRGSERFFTRSFTFRAAV